MSNFLTEVRETLIPSKDSRDGPLPPLLIGMTIITGLVDAFSYLVLGHVFVANMTGNVVFLAFALAGAPGFSIVSSLLALALFVMGSLVGGRIASSDRQTRGRLLIWSGSLQSLLLGVSVVLSLLSPKTLPTAYVYGLIVPLALSMGIQNAAARKLAVPDLTTTVLTLTIVGLGADNHFVGGIGSKAGRRLLSVTAMFIGALVGSLLILHGTSAYDLAIALIIIIIVTVESKVRSKGEPSWVAFR
jgi:uncharacterized membrane protein YoaK (UPF0700 family)